MLRGERYDRGMRNAWIVVVLRIEVPYKGTRSRWAKWRDGGIAIPVVLNDSNHATRVVEWIADRGRIVRQGGEGILFHRQIMSTGVRRISNHNLCDAVFTAKCR